MWPNQLMYIDNVLAKSIYIPNITHSALPVIGNLNARRRRGGGKALDLFVSR